MREIRDSGKVVGLDRIAVIAALNMANELIRFRIVTPISIPTSADACVSCASA